MTMINGSSNNLKSVYTVTITDTLQSLGIEDNFLGKILSFRLLIERIGERKNNNWWNSKVLDEFGGKSLGEVIPRSKTKSQIILAQKIGRKEEERVIQSTYDTYQNYVSLFYLGPFIEHKVLEAINEINGCIQLTDLEELDFQAYNVDWAKNLISSLPIEYTLKEDVITLGKISCSILDSQEEMVDILENLVFAYGKSTIDDLKVPYYLVNNE